MTKFYAHTCLLIEFSADRAFVLQSASDIFTELRPSHTCSKISMLVLAFPAMRILWSRSPHATAALFRSLKINHPEPDEVSASKIGMGEEPKEEPQDKDVVPKRGKSDLDKDAAIEVLQSLPGINHTNFRAIMKRVDSLAMLCRMSEGQLAEIIGVPNAKKLHTFLHYRATDAASRGS